MAVAPNKRWFHPNIDGMEAKKLLMEKGKHGSFLVRFSSGEKDKPNPNLTLSVRRKGEVTNIKVRRHQDGFYDLFGGEPFASLSDLIQFYMRNDDQLKEKSGEIIELRFPLNWYESAFSRRKMNHTHPHDKCHTTTTCTRRYFGLVVFQGKRQPAR